mgnify:FL=1
MKTLTGVIALMFALMFGASNVVLAAEKAAAPTAAQTKACEGKKAGDKVKVGGKDYTCPKVEAKKK